MDIFEKTTPSSEPIGKVPKRRSLAMIEIEKVKASIPAHLRQYIVDQYETHYTSEDQAVWRYTLRQLKNFRSEHAHETYS